MKDLSFPTRKLEQTPHIIIGGERKDLDPLSDIISYLLKLKPNATINEDIETELQKTKMILTPGLVKFYLQQAKREKNLNIILDRILIETETRPLLNPESTLFDIIQAKREVKTVKLADVKLLNPIAKELLLKEGIKNLMPVQQLAIDSGLLEGESLLVVAGTSSGKTLVGELAGVNNALRKS